MTSELEGTQDHASEFDLKTELEETQRALRETTLMIEQSQGEVSKLSQRNAAITSHLQQVQNQISDMPVEEIRMAYDSALDAQQRLFVMRGQLEKLQNDKTHLERYQTALANLKNGVQSSSASSPTTGSGKGYWLPQKRMACLAKDCPLPFS